MKGERRKKKDETAVELIEGYSDEKQADGETEGNNNNINNNNNNININIQPGTISQCGLITLLLVVVHSIGLLLLECACGSPIHFGTL